MDDSRDRDVGRLLALLRPAWDTARADRILAAVMERLYGRRPPRRRVPPLFAQLKTSRSRA
jgi:hypothetical protein